MLGLLLSISIVGQQLPCVHTASPLADSLVNGSARASQVATEHAGMHHEHRAAPTPPADATPRSSAPASAPHHDPAAPGCAQLMACGLAVQVTTSSTLAVADLPVTTAAPIGQYLQYSTADLEVESPPPKV